MFFGLFLFVLRVLDLRFRRVSRRRRTDPRPLDRGRDFTDLALRQGPRDDVMSGLWRTAALSGGTAPRS